MAAEGNLQLNHAEPVTNENEQEVQLKYLGHVLAAGQKATGYVATIYELAKENSGPLKSGVDKIENRVKAVVGPVYDKFEGKPLELLEFLDKKVSDSLVLLDSSVPQTVKEKTNQAYDFVKQAPDAAMSVVADVQKNGLYESVRTYYVKYEPMADEWTADTLKKLKGLPGVPFIIDLVGPSALYGAGKYNQFISILKERQIPLSSYIPLLPLEKLEKAVKSETGSKPSATIDMQPLTFSSNGN
ncbi:hypothetical protein O6H91_03G104700 [Diphasiastrum complanatum]|uniref:Uncharacterized protein n=6 Tax=Diphasiastrum complanatum TaxID=34168 RepID=A0ACC2E9X2_DIPCM|nr:hypothetical protein O6H91_03G104700 [Diphasiastrum complanatum]KAJ7563288.1 hypothetical protein O6H91_03G104700 [Diphasiastrum complanatum]KAJ7563289.1 hypothetical protein O6H91_03G104700 [Diphasiastrum complanatum]KAJ7563290.1 hypothetical protein O6H91_03G104700 [Diphasiastrum complanatum]KAJ7563291.1 hypothetical protein O6H91_03G104700 [Diphasiastrum complanatum]